MFKRILVPLDGSTRAEQALPIAAHLAQASEGTILLLHVVNTTQEAMAYGFGGAFIPPGTIEDILLEGQTYLARLIQRTHLTGMAAVEKQVVSGNPSEKILQVAQEQSVDLIVMASHGYTGFIQWLLGSVAEKVAHHAPAPVLIMREADPLHTHFHADGSTVVRALVPLDLATHEQDAIVPVAELVAALSSPGKGVLHLLQMMVLPEEASVSERESLLREASANLDTFGQQTRETVREQLTPALQPKITWSISVDSDIAEGIARVAEDGEETPESGRIEHCDLIAMTTHSLKGVQKWVTGSITDRVLHATRLPLLVVRPADVIAREFHSKKTQAQTSVEAEKV
ncbi:MAG TPA: universal stress protein [Ktedonobacteraceae bacterium]